jgi:hypothetical protein
VNDRIDKNLAQSGIVCFEIPAQNVLENTEENKENLRG